MGIVLKQSFNNTVITFIGFAFGAMNTLFLYTTILQPQYYGLVTFILATGAILMPIFAFGSHNALVKYYTAQSDSRKDGFLTLILFAPFLTLLPLALITWVCHESISNFLATENAIVKDYTWYIFIVGMAMAYFEVFYAWCKVHLKSVFGNFMKEVFGRLCISILLILLYFSVISLDFFLKGIVGVYVLRTTLVKLYAYYLRRPTLDFRFPNEYRAIFSYAALMVLGGSVALILLEIDKFMINKFIAIDNVAFYGVAVYIATIIAVPARSMNQITYPMTAALLNNTNFFDLEILYKKTSLTAFIAAGLLFILIVLNSQDLFQMLPEVYRGGFEIICLIGLAKVLDAILGNGNAILFYSRYYKSMLFFGIGLALLTVLLNLWLIPEMGIIGAALASFSAIVLFNTIKIAFVKIKFGFFPFTRATFRVFGCLVLIGLLFYFLQFPFHPLVNIALKSILMVLMYVGVLYRFDISEDVSGILSRFLQRRSR
ncbi:MAG: polysaccharide biosynthesis C-terminal domain-containing protein [Bacteroidota bacterium]